MTYAGALPVVKAGRIAGHCKTAFVDKKINGVERAELTRRYHHHTLHGGGRIPIRSAS
jgi:3-deoxy-D-arabino-heptulosonate 7-phosphate (DAHP) synthase class II